MSNNDDVYILDSYGLIYRAYFALVNRPLTNPQGKNISAVMIFFKNLKALISRYKPGYLAAAFDSRTKTFRHEMFPEYKATRQKTPQDLHDQVPWIEEILGAMKIPVLRMDGFEADDIIATVAKKCAEQNRGCRILSGDKDLLQLVGGKCMEMQPDKANGGWEEIGVDEVVAKWGIPPEKILDYLSLTGDSADNVPGVKGVGEKTALKLLSQYGALDGIYEHSDEIAGALGEKIRAGKDDAYFSKKLISLRDDVPLEISLDEFSTSGMDFSGAAAALEKYGAFSVAKSFASSGAKSFASSGEQEDDSNSGESKEGEIRELKKNSGSYRAVDRLDGLKAFVDSILASEEKLVAFDTETDSLDTMKASLVGFSLCAKKGEGIYVPVMLGGGMFAPETISRQDCVSQLERIFFSEEVAVAMHNAKFDLEVLFANGMKEGVRCRIFDTMVAAWLLNPSALGKSPYGLEFLAESRLSLKGIEFSEIVEKGKTFMDVPLEIAKDYGSEDADFTFQLCQIFRAELKSAGLEKIFYDMEMPLLPILVAMERRGIHLDESALRNYSKELARFIAQKEKEIHSIAGHEFNIASTKQLQSVLFEERNLPHGKKTKTGFSTDTAVLEELAETTEDPLPQAILDYRSYAKLQSTYVEALPRLADKDGRVHTSFLQTGTATGRLSSRDPNLQNIPVRDDAGRKIRAAFTAVPGTELVSADYSQIELVVLAHLSGDRNLRSSFIQGVDVHRSTASLIYGIPADEVTPAQRRFAKTVNFGVMYGMSAFRLARDLGISRTEAKNFIERYFATYSDVKKFIDATIQSAEEKGYVETLAGRRRPIPEILSANKMIQQAARRVAVNTPIQGTAADIVKIAMLKVDAALRKAALPARMLLQVHDELIFECPVEFVEQAIEVIRAEMEGAVSLEVPLRVSIERGNNWGEFH